MEKPAIDPLFSDDVDAMRIEIVRLRSLLDCEFRITESYRVRCEHLENIVQLFITHEYGKHQ